MRGSWPTSAPSWAASSPGPLVAFAHPTSWTTSPAGCAWVNEELWQIEDAIRGCEHRHEFDSEFIELARSVYQRNDERADIKRRINRLLGTRIAEEKSYTVARLNGKVAV